MSRGTAFGPAVIEIAIATLASAAIVVGVASALDITGQNAAEARADAAVHGAAMRLVAQVRGDLAAAAPSQDMSAMTLQVMRPRPGATPPFAEVPVSYALGRQKRCMVLAARFRTTAGPDAAPLYEAVLVVAGEGCPASDAAVQAAAAEFANSASPAQDERLVVGPGLRALLVKRTVRVRPRGAP